MPTAPTHALVALALGAAFHRPGVPRRLLLAGAACAVLPDLDVVGFRFGVSYGDLLGHRGLSHSLAAAALMGAVVGRLAFAGGAGPLSTAAVWAYLTLATASHGLLDGLTDGGLGIAWLAPFDNTRYFWPLRPVAVAPIGFHGLLHPRMLRVLWTELLWIWLPSAVFVAIVVRARRFTEARVRRRRSHSPPPN